MNSLFYKLQNCSALLVDSMIMSISVVLVIDKTSNLGIK